MKKIKQTAGLFLVGGIVYAALEVLWRGRSHWTMALTGGTVTVALERLRGKLRGFSLGRHCLAGAALITSAELVVGLTVNRHYRMRVWDYSAESFNIKGQICLKYTILWGILAIPAFISTQKLSGILKKK